MLYGIVINGLKRPAEIVLHNIYPTIFFNQANLLNKDLVRVIFLH